MGYRQFRWIWTAIEPIGSSQQRWIEIMPAWMVRRCFRWIWIEIEPMMKGASMISFEGRKFRVFRLSVYDIRYGWIRVELTGEWRGWVAADSCSWAHDRTHTHHREPPATSAAWKEVWNTGEACQGLPQELSGGGDEMDGA
ncbi:hypothetical protein E3N88_34938 [Mikania micrantha]|uniref:Uncharacterized protein n=1 Tax=Mikania micrantha TaxID=192012 RepID=A0A5N6LZP5_9ASTR|nr:hypothetical protein E3N88_34938 [Mikania micrantha]